MQAGQIKSFSWVSILLVLAHAQGFGQAKPEQGRNVRLDVVSVVPERDDVGDLNFRVRLRITNHSARPVWIDSLEVNSPQPYFVRYQKHLTWSPWWLHVWPFQDAPPEGLFKLDPGRSIEFEDVVPSISYYRMLPEEGIPIRGVHRARLRYYTSRKDGELAHLAGTIKLAKLFWVVSDSFRFDWPAQK